MNDHLFYLSDVLFFFVGYDNYYSLTEYSEDGEVQDYEVHDDKGKYFVRPPKTEWEKLCEERQNQEAGSDGLPF